MPYHIAWEEPFGAYIKLAGCVAPADFEQLIAEVTSDRRFDDLRYVIADYLDADDHSFPDHGAAVGTASAVAIGSFYSNPRLIEVAVATKPRLVELARAYASITQFPFQIFPTVAAAREWVASQSMSLRSIAPVT